MAFCINSNEQSPPATHNFVATKHCRAHKIGRALFSLITTRSKLLICLICADVHSAAIQVLFGASIHA